MKRFWDQHSRKWSIPAALALVALCAFWLIFEGLYQQRLLRKHAQTEAESYAYRANVLAERRCAGLDPDAQFSCKQLMNETARQGRRSEREVEAQLVSSLWAKQVGVATILTTLISMISAALIFFTFKQTRSTGQRQLRAYAGVRDAWHNPKAVKLEFRIVNSGQTAAFKVFVTSKSVINESEPMFAPHDFGILDPAQAMEGGINDKRMTTHKKSKTSTSAGSIEFKSEYCDIYKRRFVRIQNFEFLEGTLPNEKGNIEAGPKNGGTIEYECHCKFDRCECAPPGGFQILSV